MSTNIQFEKYNVEVKEVLTEKAIQFLHEIGGEIRSLAQRKSRRKTSQTAGSYQFKVDEDELAVHIGSDYWNAIYEEFGTGSHAVNGDGRTGYWIFVDDGSGFPQSPKGGKNYTLEEAKRIMAIMRKKGLNAYYTNGKEANKPLYSAFVESEGRIKKTAEEYFGGI